MKMNYQVVIAAAFLLSGVSIPASAQPEPNSVLGASGTNYLDALDLKSLLNTKVITASKFSENIADAPGIISVVSQDELQRFGAMTLGEILGQVPGLAGTTAYFTDRNMVAVRGDQTRTDGGHVLFLINGRPTREILEGGITSDLLESFPVSALERIEVIKGPGSVLYGSNAFSGVINLITKKPRANTLTVTALGGAEGARSASGLVTFKQGDLSIVGAGEFHQNPDWTTTYRYPEALLGDPFAGHTQTAIQTATLQQGGVGAVLGANYKGLSFMSSFTQSEAPSFVRGTVGSTQWRRGFADLGYGIQVKPGWNMDFHLTRTQTTLAGDGDAQIGRDSNELLFEWTNFVTLSAKDRLTVGAVYNHVQGTETFFGSTPSLIIANGGWSGITSYAQLDHQLTDSIKLVGGLQANKVGPVALNIVPRGGVIWSLGPHVSVKALYSQAFRAPSIDETLLNHPGLQGNPNLVPERVATLDLGISYQGNRVQAGFTYFHSVQTNNIVIETVTPRWQFVNSGGATFNGVELETKYYLKKNFYLLGSAIYQVNGNGLDRHIITPVGNLGLKAGISYQVRNGLTASVFDVYDGPPRAYATTLNPEPGSHDLINSQVRYDLTKYLGAGSKNGLAFVVHAENLTNKQVWVSDWGGGSGDSIPALRGRTVYAGLEFSLSRE